MLFWAHEYRFEERLEKRVSSKLKTGIEQLDAPSTRLCLEIYDNLNRRDILVTRYVQVGRADLHSLMTEYHGAHVYACIHTFMLHMHVHTHITAYSSVIYTHIHAYTFHSRCQARTWHNDSDARY
jgi:hypothetical protein